MEKLAGSVREVAQALGVSEKQIRRGIKAGRIPSYRLGDRILIPWNALATHIDREALAACQGGTS